MSFPKKPSTFPASALNLKYPKLTSPTGSKALNHCDRKFLKTLMEYDSPNKSRSQQQNFVSPVLSSIRNRSKSAVSSKSGLRSYSRLTPTKKPLHNVPRKQFVPKYWQNSPVTLRSTHKSKKVIERQESKESKINETLNMESSFGFKNQDQESAIPLESRSASFLQKLILKPEFRNKVESEQQTEMTAVSENFVLEKVDNRSKAKHLQKSSLEKHRSKSLRETSIRKHPIKTLFIREKNKLAKESVEEVICPKAQKNKNELDDIVEQLNSETTSSVYKSERTRSLKDKLKDSLKLRNRGKKLKRPRRQIAKGKEIFYASVEEDLKKELNTSSTTLIDSSETGKDNIVAPNESKAMSDGVQKKTKELARPAKKDPIVVGCITKEQWMKNLESTRRNRAFKGTKNISVSNQRALQALKVGSSSLYANGVQKQINPMKLNRPKKTNLPTTHKKRKASTTSSADSRLGFRCKGRYQDPTRPPTLRELHQQRHFRQQKHNEHKCLKKTLKSSDDSIDQDVDLIPVRDVPYSSTANDSKCSTHQKRMVKKMSKNSRLMEELRNIQTNTYAKFLESRPMSSREPIRHGSVNVLYSSKGIQAKCSAASMLATGLT